MNIVTVWTVIMLAGLVAELVTVSLYGACAAVAAFAGLIAYLFGLAIYFQIPIAIAVAVFMLVVLRPIGMKYVNRVKRQNRIQNLVGCDAIVICRIDNSQGVGVVSVNGKQWSARSHRPNAVIDEGSVVTIIAMKGDTAIVDDNRRNGNRR